MYLDESAQMWSFMVHGTIFRLNFVKSNGLVATLWFGVVDVVVHGTIY